MSVWMGGHPSAMKGVTVNFMERPVSIPRQVRLGMWKEQMWSHELGNWNCSFRSSVPMLSLDS